MFTYREKNKKYNRDWIEKIITKSFKLLDKNKLAKLAEDDEKLDKILRRQFELILSEIEKAFRKNKTATLKEHRAIASDFKKSHNHTWKKPIDLLKYLFLSILSIMKNSMVGIIEKEIRIPDSKY